MKFIRPITFFLFFLLSLQVNAQEGFLKLVKEYFRVNPFAGKFSAFVDAVKTDPDIIDKKFTEKTDSTLFEIKGLYQTFNPFKIVTDQVKIELSEKLMPFQTDSATIFEPVVTYQITGFFTKSEKTQAIVMKEYKRLNNRLKNDEMLSRTQAINNIQSIKEGTYTHFYFSTFNPISPITICKYTTSDNKSLALMIILRMKYFNNKAAPGGTIIFNN